jgi:plasmid maintenance system antidote protein VapI
MTDDFFQSDLSFLGDTTVVQPRAATATRPSRARTHNIAGLSYELTYCSDTRAKISDIVTAAWQNNPARRRINSQVHKNKIVTADTRAKLSAANCGRKLSPQALVNLQSAIALMPGGAPNARRIMTPSGEFSSKKAAAEWATANGLPNAAMKISKWLKTHPELFYYITKDTK